MTDTGTASRRLRDELHDMIISYALSAGEPLPEVRVLASKRAVNPRLVLHVYGQLEQEGFVCRGADGAYTVASEETVRALRLSELFEQFDTAAEELSRLSVEVPELTARLSKRT